MLYLVVPTFNRCHKLANLFSLLSSQTYSDFTVIVINDGSTDDTQNFLTEKQPFEFRVLNGDGSLWWGGAIHMGIESIIPALSDVDLVLLLNDDVEFSIHYLQNLVDASNKRPNCVLGSLQKYVDVKNEYYKGFFVNTEYYSIKLVETSSPQDESEVNALPGRGMLIPAKVVLDIGNVRAEQFPHYMCDLDYSFLAHRKGYEIRTEPSAEVLTGKESSDHGIVSRGSIYSLLHSRSKNNVMNKIKFFKAHTNKHIITLVICHAWKIVKAYAQAFQSKTLGLR